jgi:hypothetical protein
VDSSASETEPSSLQCLTKLDQSNAVVPTEPENIEDAPKAITGKYLNQLLAIVVNGLQPTDGPLTILSCLKLELSLAQSFAFAEQKSLIPATDATRSWKKGMKSHEQLFQLLKSTVEDEADDDE